MGDSREKSLRFDSNTDSVEGEKVFEEKRNYRSDITGMSVRLKSELVFEMRRNLHPPIWVAMLISSIAYFWAHRYMHISHNFETPLEYSSLAITAVAMLAGIVSASIYHLIVKNEIEPEKKSHQKQLLTEVDNVFDTLLKTPEKLVGWLDRETPVEHPNDDYFDLRVYAHRIAGILRESALRTIAIVGPYGCGKSSILKMIDFYLINSKHDESTHSSNSSYSKPKKILTCSVSGWGFHEHRISEHIISSAVKRLSQEVDCAGLANLPSQYRSAISSSDSFWGKIISGLFEGSSDPLDVLRKIDNVLSTVEKRLVVFIEDLDRNVDDELFWSEAIALLDRLKNLDHVSFILAIGTTTKKLPYSDTLLRIAEHIEVVPPLTWQQLYSLVGRFRDTCLQAFNTDIACQPKEKANERLGLYSVNPEEKDHLLKLLDSLQGRPIRRIANIMMTPRIIKTALRRTWQTWQNLHGEIDLDDLLVANIIRTVLPEAFIFMNANISRMRSLKNNEAVDSVREKLVQTREELRKEYEEIVKKAGLDEKAMNSLMVLLCPDWEKDSFYRPEVPQGIILGSVTTNYWKRLTNESLDSFDIPDQFILQAITGWKNNIKEEGNSFANNLLQKEGFSEKIKQFGFLLDGHEVRKMAEHLFALILSQNKKMGKQEEYRGFIELWQMAMDKPIEGHEDWILDQIDIAIPVSLGFTSHLYYYWHNTDRNMIEVDCPQPALRKGFIAKAETAFRGKPEKLLHAIGFSPIYSLYHLVFLYSQPRYGGLNFEQEDWHWLSDTILQAAEITPKLIIPQIVGFAVRAAYSRGEFTFQFVHNDLQRLFLEKEPQAIQLISTEFDESELNEDDVQIVHFARQEATNWLVQVKEASQIKVDKRHFQETT